MMRWLRRFRARIRYRHFEGDLQAEIETHRSLLQDDLARSGADNEAARAAAARALGNVTLQREQARGVWLAPWLESLWQDARYGVRSLRRSPAFSLAALATLTIGLALATMMFTAFSVFALNPWKVAHTRGLAQLRLEGGPPDRQRGFSLADVEDIAARSRTVSAIGAYRMRYCDARSGEIFTLNQGRFSGRPSVIDVKPRGTADAVHSVLVGGKVAIVGHGTLEVLP